MTDKPVVERTEAQKQEDFWKEVAKTGKVYGHPDTIVEWLEKTKIPRVKSQAGTIWRAPGDIEIISIQFLPKGQLFAGFPEPDWFRMGELFQWDRTVRQQSERAQNPQDDEQDHQDLDDAFDRGVHRDQRDEVKRNAYDEQDNDEADEGHDEFSC